MSKNKKTLVISIILVSLFSAVNINAMQNNKKNQTPTELNENYDKIINEIKNYAIILKQIDENYKTANLEEIEEYEKTLNLTENALKKYSEFVDKNQNKSLKNKIAILNIQLERLKKYINIKKENND